MSMLPAVPGNDSPTDGFEGFANKEAAKGTPIFAAKNEPQAAPGNGSMPPGATETAGYPTPQFKSKPLPPTFA